MTRTFLDGLTGLAAYMAADMIEDETYTPGQYKLARGILVVWSQKMR